MQYIVRRSMIVQAAKENNCRISIEGPPWLPLDGALLPFFAWLCRHHFVTIDNLKHATDVIRNYCSLLYIIHLIDYTSNKVNSLLRIRSWGFSNALRRSHRSWETCQLGFHLFVFEKDLSILKLLILIYTIASGFLVYIREGAHSALAEWISLNVKSSSIFIEVWITLIFQFHPMD